MPKFVRVHDTETGHEFDVHEDAVAALPESVRVLEDDVVEGRTAQARPATFNVEREPAGEPSLPDDAPAKSASKADWVAFAVQNGMDESTAESQTRDALIAHFTQEP